MTWPDPAVLRPHRQDEQLVVQQTRIHVPRGRLTDSIFRRQLHSICVKELQEGAVDWVGELVNFNHFLHVFIPVRLEHRSEVLTPVQQMIFTPAFYLPGSVRHPGGEILT